MLLPAGRARELALDVLLFLSGLTMLLGVLGAMCRWEIRAHPLLAHHQPGRVHGDGDRAWREPDPRVAQLAVAGTIFDVVHHIVVKSCLFLLRRHRRARERHASTLKQMGGVIERRLRAWRACSSWRPCSLAGMPPFSGFLSKYVLAQAGLAGGNYVVVTVAVVTSFLTLLLDEQDLVVRLLGRAPPARAPRRAYRGMMLPTAVLVGLHHRSWAWSRSPSWGSPRAAAETITKPDEYIRVVLSAKQNRVAAVLVRVRRGGARRGDDADAASHLLRRGVRLQVHEGADPGQLPGGQAGPVPLGQSSSRASWPCRSRPRPTSRSPASQTPSR